MTEQQTQVERYLAAFESLQQDGFSQDPLWIQKLREAAIRGGAKDCVGSEAGGAIAGTLGTKLG